MVSLGDLHQLWEYFCLVDVLTHTRQTPSTGPPIYATCSCWQVLVKVGGSFTLAQNSSQKPSLFVAGGIGITALSSMIADLVEQQQAEAQAAAGAERRVPRPFILYSGVLTAAEKLAHACCGKLLSLYQAMGKPLLSPVLALAGLVLWGTN